MGKKENEKEKKTEAGVSQKALFNLLEDVTEARDGLAKAKEYLDNIIKSMIETLIVVDPDILIRTVNKAACALLGYKEEELIGKPAAIIFAEATPLKGNRMKRLMDEGSIRDYEMTYKAKSGEEIPVSFSGSVMRDKQGNLVGIVGIAGDMREIKRLMQKEKELAATAAAAETERKKAKELEIAYRRLQETKDMLVQAEKLSVAGQLASGVAHEVRNPLAVIKEGISYLEYLEEKSLLKEKRSSELIGMIKNNVKRADDIISSLLDFSKPAKLDLQPEDVNSILEYSLTLAKSKFKSKSIRIKRETKKDIPKILADKGRMGHAFVNILLNAVQSLPAKGEIIIRSYDRVLEEEKAVIVEIEDTGAGISEENLKKIFVPFFTTKRPSKAVGLGLYVSRNILTTHRALIDVKSQVGKGTKITITLKAVV